VLPAASSGHAPCYNGKVTAHDIDQLADRIFRAIETGDEATVAALWSDDVVVWHNFDQKEQTKAENLATLHWLTTRCTDLAYTDVRRDLLADGFAQQHVLRGLSPAGRPFAVPAMLRVTVRDGLVVRIDEYLDSAQTGRLGDA
jgi:ketosteroid isomerase-like protein